MNTIPGSIDDGEIDTEHSPILYQDVAEKTEIEKRLEVVERKVGILYFGVHEDGVVLSSDESYALGKHDGRQQVMDEQARLDAMTKLHEDFTIPLIQEIRSELKELRVENEALKTHHDSIPVNEISTLVASVKGNRNEMAIDAIWDAVSIVGRWLTKQEFV